MEIQYTVSTNSIDSIGMGNDDEILIRSSNSVTVHIYKYRWFILTLYSLLAFSNTLVWLSLFTVTDATSVFYNVDSVYIIWSSMASTCVQCIIAIPASLLPSKLGLRATMVIAASINALGACVVIIGAHRNGFVYFVIGQTIIAIAASILPQLAPEVSAVWFGKDEQAISTSIGITVGNAGAAVGFLQPALLIKNVDVTKHIDYVGDKIKIVIYSQAAMCVFLLFAVLIFFKGRPKKPPSVSQAIRPGPGAISFKDFKANCKEVMANRDYVIAGNIFALSSMIIVVVPVILNEIMSWKFPNHDATFGWMGFGGIIAGIFGSIIFSLLLDKTKQFKRIAIAIGIASLIMWITFTETLKRVEILSLSVSIFIIALFIFVPFGPIIVDMIAELTYPVQESTSFVIPITGGRLYSIPITFLAGYLTENSSYYAACHIVTGVLLACIFLLVIVRVELKRSKATSDDVTNANVVIVPDDVSSVTEGDLF